MMRKSISMTTGVLALGLLVAIPAKAALVAQYSFDGNVNDQSGTGNNGTLIGTPGYDPSVPFGGGQSIAFNGADQGVNVAAAASLNSGVFTLSYFINPNGATQDGGFERLTSRGGDTFETAISGTGELSYFSPGTGWRGTGQSVAATGWTHVAWRNAGTGVTDYQLFLDGVMVHSNQGITAPSGHMNIGIRHNNAEGFEGLMDDFRLYDTALSDAEIAGLAVPEPSSVLVGLLGLALMLRRRR